MGTTSSVLELIGALAWCAFVVGLLVRATSQYRSFPELTERHAQSDCSDERLPRVTFVVPARNEASNIGRCLGGLLAQRYPRSRYDIVVVDDGSTDETPQIVRRHIAAGASNVHLQPAEPLPADWAGKPHACWQGANVAAAQRADWLCFVDADTVAEPDFLRAAVRAAASDGGDMFSICPRQQLATFSERAFFPVGFMMIAFVQDVRTTADAASPQAAANGQCLLIRRDVYAECGGHAAVAQDVCEDSALARLFKAAGYRVVLMGGERFIRTRMYANWRELRQGLAKNIVDALGGVCKTLLSMVLAVFLTAGIVAVPYLTASSPIAFGIAVLASCALFATYVRAAVYFNTPVWYAALFPIGYALGTAIAIAGLSARLRGEVAWKDRVIQRQPLVRARWSSILRVASKIRLIGARR
jgi:chlorobactene glucosyltransferase